MKIFQSLDSNKIVVYIALLLATFIIYPNIVNVYRVYQGQESVMPPGFFTFFFFRYIFFGILIWILLTYNIRKIQSTLFGKRLLVTLGITITGYALYILISQVSGTHSDCFTGILVFQFIVSWSFCAFIGHVYSLNAEQAKREIEIEQLKLENLQSRYDALTNQINPHFLFNTINGLDVLIRKEEKQKMLEYTSGMSSLFRYILQSDKKGLVPLREEIEFLDAYSYLNEVRYADKLSFRVDIPVDKYEHTLPVLSLLPLIENVVKHNIIDSEHLMVISVYITKENELAVSNPVHEKIDKTLSNGIGLSNLSTRFRLLLNRDIHVENQNGVFTVYLPLNK